MTPVTIDLQRSRMTMILAMAAVAAAGLLAGCGKNAEPRKPFQVGTVAHDADLPPEPTLPTPDQVCTTVYASERYVKRPDGALPPEADASPTDLRVGAAVDRLVVNPDQARIQAALNACAQLVNAEIGATVLTTDRAALQPQYATSNVKNLAGASGEELARAEYRATRFAVRLSRSQTGRGDAFISGPLSLPSGVTLWIDEGVTLFATRDVTAYNIDPRTSTAAKPKWCGNVNVRGNAGTSGNCWALINGDNLVNSAVVGDGSIDARAYAELVSTDPYYPLLKVDLTCTNTYAGWVAGRRDPDGTPCDDGGTFVDSASRARNMTWWDLAFLGNMVENGRTGASSQSNFRMMVFNYAKNLTLYRITLNNSANFHVVPLGVDGLTVWNVKLQTPSLAAYANPAGNGNPLYNGFLFDKDNVKNTDAFDPGSASKPTAAGLALGWDVTYAATSYAYAVAQTSAKMQFDGYTKNLVFAYNHVSTGDDDIVLKGSNNPSPWPIASTTPTNSYYGIDGDRDARGDRAHGIMIAHNHIYWGHGISIGSETNSGVRNVWVYDNSFEDSEEGLRIKSDYARGGPVEQIYYENICIKNAQNALLFTPYYSTKAVDAGKGALIPDFHDIHLKNVRILGASSVKLMGFQADAQGYPGPATTNPQVPLVMSLDHVVADDPTRISLISSDAELTLDGVNLPILPSAAARVNVDGMATRAVDPSQAVDCSRAFVPFPTLTSPAGTTW